jgi:hypothetical protein
MHVAVTLKTSYESEVRKAFLCYIISLYYICILNIV